MENSKFRKSVLGIVLLGLVIIFVGSFTLRPTADDYWYGALVAQYGVWGATLELWNTWTSFAVSMVFANVLVGWPLATLPLGISSAIPFWCAALAIGYVSYAFVSYQFCIAKISKLLFFLFCTFLWLSFVFADSLQFLMLTHHLKHRIVLGLVHWQNLNANYLFYMCCIVLFFLWFFKNKISWAFSFFLACLLGIIQGLVGIAVTLSFVTVIFCIMCWQAYFKQLSKQMGVFYVTFIIISLVSSFMGMKLSPGHAVRMSDINPNAEFTVERAIDVFLYTFLPTFHRLSELYLNLGTVLTLAVLVFFWLALGKSFTLKHGMSPKNMALFLTFVCIAFTAVTRFGQAFAYSKPWHFIPAFMFLHLSLFFWSYCIAEKIQKRKQYAWSLKKVQGIFIGLLCIHLVFTIAGVGKIYEREKIWAVGPAPVRDGNDIEKENWLKYWNELNKYRSEPFEERRPK